MCVTGDDWTIGWCGGNKRVVGRDEALFCLNVQCLIHSVIILNNCMDVSTVRQMAFSDDVRLHLVSARILLVYNHRGSVKTICVHVPSGLCVRAEGTLVWASIVNIP